MVDVGPGGCGEYNAVGAFLHEEYMTSVEAPDEMRPNAAEMRPRCGRDAAEMRPREMRPAEMRGAHLMASRTPTPTTLS